MIAVDTNILIGAHRRDSEFHGQATASLTELVESGKRWGIPWPCIHEFWAIATHPRIFKPPSTLQEASLQIETWLSSPRFQPIGESPGYWEQLKEILLKGKITGPPVHDARIAAICIQNGVTELWSADRDFSRIGNLKVVNPLVN